MKNLATLNYWINIHGKLDISLKGDDVFENWITKYIDYTKINTSIEIGCFPGKFLTILGKRGVEVNGIDFIPSVVDLEEVFKEKGYIVGEFINADFTKYKFQKKYDCVMSFGFIEHFKNWEEIISMHLELVSENGYVIIEAPNFRGVFQRLPRYIFDYKNYRRHNIDSMNLEKWNEIIKKNGFEIVTSNYFGGFNLWFENNSKNIYIIKLRVVIFKILKKIKNKLYPNLKEDSSFSCMMGIIAKRI